MGQNLNLAGIFFGAATSVGAAILDFLKVTNEWVRELSPPIAFVSGILAIAVAIKHLRRKEK